MGTITETLSTDAARSIDRLDAQLLLLHALERAPGQRAWLFAHDRDDVPTHAADAFTTLAQRRAAGEPLAYLTGWREFHGLRLKVDARVLDPRPDTETLVDWALDVLGGRSSPRVLDLGCGSGAIALAIKQGCSRAEVHAVDLSPAALEVARENAAALGLDVEFSCRSWCEGLDPSAFELIVSNPPYLAENDPHLSVLGCEPRLALVAGPDGLEQLRAVIAQAGAHLRPGGWLLLEHGCEQARAVCERLVAVGFEQVQSRRDLAGLPRCSGGRKPPG